MTDGTGIVRDWISAYNDHDAERMRSLVAPGYRRQTSGNLLEGLDIFHVSSANGPTGPMQRSRLPG